MSSDAVDAHPGTEENNSHDEPRQDNTAPPKISKSDFISDKYNMRHQERGMAVIINNKNFQTQTMLAERSGTDADFQKMNYLLLSLGFEKIRPIYDATVREMKDALCKAADEDHTNSDCFAVVILSHGEEGYVYGTDDKVPIDELLLPFKGHTCTSLAGKPKLFLIQACKGQEKVCGRVEADNGDEEEDEEEEIVMRIPSEADFLIFYSLVPGYLAWNNKSEPNQGSWFIEAVHDVFMKHYKELDLMKMLIKINRKVASDFESNACVEYLRRKKQIPCITSTLTKDLFFS